MDFEEGVGGGQCTGPSLGVDLQGGQQGGHRRSNARSERGGEQDFDEEDEGDGRMRGGDIDVADIVDGRGGDEPQGDMHDQGSKRGREGGYASLPHRRPRGDAGEGESASEDGGALEEGWQALRSRGEAAAVTMCVWVIYWMTMPRAITGGDSGEVMAAACSWAPAHPPGYPLFVALSQGAMWAFRGLGGSPAYRVNLMCSLFSAGAVYNLHRAVKVLTGDGSAALVAAGMYGLSPLIWNNAIQAEVFSLNNLFVCLVTNVAVQYLSRNRTYGKQAHHLAYVGAFSSGLGLTNQHTLVFYLAIIVPAVLWSGRDALLRPLPFLSLALLFFVGLVPYSLTWINRGCPLPWDEHEGAILGTKLCPGAEQVPRYTWGDSRSFRGFMNHLLRRDYGTLSLAAGGASAHGKPVSLLTGLAFYLEDTAGPRLDERVRGGSIVSHDGQLLYFGVPFALLGAYLCMASPSRERHAAAKRTLLVAYVIYLVVFHYLANLPIRVALFRAVHARFWQMPNRLYSPPASLPFHGTTPPRYEYLRLPFSHVLSRSLPRSTLFVFLGLGFSRSMRGLPASFRWLLGLLGVCLQCVHNYAQQDQSRNVAVEMLARTALESAPQNAIIICSGDLQLNPALYLSVCEGVRPDVSVLSLQLMSYRWYAHNKTERYPAVIFPGKSHWPDEDGYSLQGFFQANIDARPIMIYGGNRPAETLERLRESHDAYTMLLMHLEMAVFCTSDAHEVGFRFLPAAPQWRMRASTRSSFTTCPTASSTASSGPRPSAQTSAGWRGTLQWRLRRWSCGRAGGAGWVTSPT